jgi:hypothetical protein
MDKLIKMFHMIQDTAKKDTYDEIDENFVPYDYFGGNMDDAYDGGLQDGEILFARSLLGMLKDT